MCLPVFIFQAGEARLDPNIHTIYHIKASDALSRRHWAADVSLIVFIVFGPARVRARKPPFSAEVRKCAVTAIVKQPAGCRRVYPETLVKGGEHWCRGEKRRFVSCAAFPRTRHRPGRVGLLPFFP